MTKALYYEKKFILDSKLLEVRKIDTSYVLILEESIFYPNSGGQLADRGFIDGREIVNVEVENGIIYHFILEKDYQYFKGKEEQLVRLEVDQEARISHSIYHTAQHLISSLVYEDYEANTLSFHMGEEYATIDFDHGDILVESLRLIEKKLWDLIGTGAPITTKTYKTLQDLAGVDLRKQPKFDKNIRLVTIEGYAASPCCGTHLADIRDIRLIKIFKTEKIKKKLRVYYLAGDDAFKDYQKKAEVTNKIANFYTTDPEVLYDKIILENQKFKDLVKKNNLYENKIIATEVKLFLEQKEPVLIWEFKEKNHNPKYLEKVGNLILNQYQEQSKGKIFLLVLNSENKIITISNNEKIKIGDLVRQNVDVFNGKGGGNQLKAQAFFKKNQDMFDFLDSLKVMIQSQI